MREYRGRVRVSWWMCLLVALIWAEFMLQLLAFGYRWWDDRARESPDPEAELTILSLGDCFTLGFGADVHRSYPGHLERLLQREWPDRKVQVLNAGIGGVNSSQIVRRLPRYLGDARPDLVLLMTGASDEISFLDVDHSTLQAVAAPKRTLLKVHLLKWLSRIQLYRLAKYLSSPWPESNQAQATGATGSSDEAIGPLSQDRLIEELRELVKTKPSAALQVLRDPAVVRYQDQWTREEFIEHVVPWVRAVLQPHVDRRGSSMRLKRLFRDYREHDVADQLQIAIYQRVLARASNEVDTLEAQAQIHMAQGEFDRAQALWERLIERNPGNPQLYVKIALAQNRQGLMDEGIASGRAALALDPKLELAYYLMGSAFRVTRRLEEAQAMYRRTVELDPRRVQAWVRLAEVSRDLGQVEPARMAWWEGFQQNLMLEALVGLGQSYQDPEQGREAMQALLNDVKASRDLSPAFWQPYDRVVAQGVVSEGSSLGRQLLAHNFERIIEEARKQGIEVVLLTYPDAVLDPWPNEDLRRIATRHPEILFIDLYAFMVDRMVEDPTLDLVSENGRHPNADGYELLASHIVDSLANAGLLESVPPAEGDP